MSGNSFGTIFKITTFGESHGKAVGVVIDGCPSKIKISEDDIQKEVDKRKPKSSISTSRAEKDKIQILSGIFKGKTLGTPIAILVENSDTRACDYSEKLFRKGHADLTYQLKYGFRDHRGGGRASGRETVARVIAGAIAKKILPRSMKIESKIVQIGNIKGKNITLEAIEKYAKNISDDSFGGILRITVKKTPKGLGEPVFDKLDAEIAKALMSIGAVKGVEIGAGFGAASLKGSENNKNSDGIYGGISDGKDINIRIAIKPTPSIRIKGRHDKCIVPRVAPVAESMVAIVLADHFLRQRALK